MKELLNRRTIIIFSTAFLLAIIAIVSVNVFNSPGPVTGAANIITRPVRAVVSSVAKVFGTIFSSVYEYEVLLSRVDELQRQIVEMEIDFRESQLLAEENARLRLLLDFRTRHSDYEHEQASIESWGGDNWSSSFVINIGSNQGISPGMGVVTEYGALIGQVHDVGLNSSTVITILDTKFSAAAYVGRRDAGDDASGSSVAKGDFSYMGSGMLLLDQIDDEIVIRRGDRVVTSGLGTVFPAGLIIGEVHDVIRHTSGIGRFALIVPMVTFETISIVFVITGFAEAEQGAGSADFEDVGSVEPEDVIIVEPDDVGSVELDGVD